MADTEYLLPPAAYHEQDWFDREQEQLFEKVWNLVALVHDVSEPGDYVATQVGRAPLLVVRGKDGEIRAFHNLCRHRGSRVCKAVEGRVKRFVCPYHGWSYGLDGRLLGAWAMPKEFDKSAHGLHEIACQVFHGLIFINFAGGVGDFDRVRAALDEALTPFQLERTKVAHSERHRPFFSWADNGSMRCESSSPMSSGVPS